MDFREVAIEVKPGEVARVPLGPDVIPSPGRAWQVDGDLPAGVTITYARQVSDKDPAKRDWWALISAKFANNFTLVFEQPCPRASGQAFDARVAAKVSFVP